jgi:hypothetical protein
MNDDFDYPKARENVDWDLDRAVERIAALEVVNASLEAENDALKIELSRERILDAEDLRNEITQLKLRLTEEISARGSIARGLEDEAARSKHLESQLSQAVAVLEFYAKKKHFNMLTLKQHAHLEVEDGTKAREVLVILKDKND